MRPISTEAALFVAAREGEVDHPYQDSGGVWTDGVGHTQGVNSATAPITHEVALQQLQNDLLVAEKRLYARTKPGVIDNLTEDEFIALLSWAYNVPDDNWTLYAKLNAGLLNDIPGELVKFVYIGKTFSQGLQNRRAAEVAQWNLSADTRQPLPPTTGNIGTMPSRRPFNAAAMGLKALTLVGGSAEALTQYGAQLQPVIQSQAGNSHVLAQVAEGLAIVIVAASAVAIFVHKYQDSKVSK